MGMGHQTQTETATEKEACDLCVRVHGVRASGWKRKLVPPSASRVMTAFLWT